MEDDKITCEECGWQGHMEEVDQIKDPKSEMLWCVCPQCRVPEHLLSVCDEDGCWELRSCGTPTEDGYRSTCAKHRPGQETNNSP